MAAAQTARIDVSSLLEQCATLADSLASAKNVQIVRKFPSGLRAYTQPVALQSIITNLLANAVEYSHAGGSVELTCRLAGGQLELSVKDNGPGISPDVLPHIFQPFYRADGSHGSSDGHLGLGLFLVQSHARSMGGRCEVQSTVGAGSIFRVEFPALPPASADSATLNEEDAGTASDVIESSRVAMET